MNVKSNKKGKYQFQLKNPNGTVAANAMKGNEMTAGHHLTFLFQTNTASELSLWVNAIGKNIYRNPFQQLMETRRAEIEQKDEVSSSEKTDSIHNGKTKKPNHSNSDLTTTHSESEDFPRAKKKSDLVETSFSTSSKKIRRSSGKRKEEDAGSQPSSKKRMDPTPEEDDQLNDTRDEDEKVATPRKKSKKDKSKTEPAPSDLAEKEKAALIAAEEADCQIPTTKKERRRTKRKDSVAKA